MERNQVLYSPVTGKYYFVSAAQRVGGEGTLLRVSGKKIDVTASVKPLIAYSVAHHLRTLARSPLFTGAAHRKLLEVAREVEKKAGIGAASDEG